MNKELYEMVLMLQSAGDGICFSCIYSPQHDICSNAEINDGSTCYDGIKALRE